MSTWYGSAYLAIHIVHHLSQFGSESTSVVEPNQTSQYSFQTRVDFVAITYRSLRLKDGVGRRILSRDGCAWLALAN